MSPHLPFTSLISLSLEVLSAFLSSSGATFQLMWEEGLPSRVMAQPPYLP